jgi:hypothetical protein
MIRDMLTANGAPTPTRRRITASPGPDQLAETTAHLFFGAYAPRHNHR